MWDGDKSKIARVAKLPSATDLTCKYPCIWCNVPIVQCLTVFAGSLHRTCLIAGKEMPAQEKRFATTAKEGRDEARY